jgi:hypothetical protein
MHSIKRQQLIEEIASTISACLLVIATTFLLLLGGCDNPVELDDVKTFSAFTFRDVEFDGTSDSL